MWKGGFKDLVVWQKAKDLAVLVYQVTDEGKIVQDFGLRDQMRRAAVSACSNIADSEAVAAIAASGDERKTDKDSVRFFYISKGSLAELVTQIEIAHEIGYISREQMVRVETDCANIANMLGALIKSRSRL